MNVRRFESDASAAVLAELRSMAPPSGKLRTSSCLPKLGNKLRLPSIAVDEAIRDLYRAGMLSYQADGRELPASGHIFVVLEPVRANPLETAWLHALDAAGIGQVESGALSALAPVLGGLTPQDLAVLARGLRQLSEVDQAATDDAGFNVSARHLMGSSKVLSRMSARMLETLGLPLRLRNSSPRYVICAGPPEPVATLLIENPMAFENAVSCGLSQDVALICTYGFGLSYLGQEWLHTNKTPEHDRPILIVRGGSPPPISELLKGRSVFFWGDLDLAAISIYKALQRAFPGLQMSRIYESMLSMVRDEELSHPYCHLFDKSGQVRADTVDNYEPLELDPTCLVLWRACKVRAVDQEAVPLSTIRVLGSYGLVP